jgi:tetratricopeptide (TPR) repeat protein
MRHAIHLVWLLPFLGAAALGADDLPQPKKDVTPPAAFPDLPAPRTGAGGPPDADAAELQRLLRQLRSQRDALRNERGSAEREVEAPAPATSNEEEIARLRKRMEELAGRGGRRADAAAPTPPRPVEPLPLPLPQEGETPKGGAIDPVAVAQNYFRAGDYEAALEAYRNVPTRGALAEERAPVLYMIATCLRKLGKRDEAAKAYRQVAGIKDDPFVADCARWQLETLAWRKDVETQLAQLRQRRKGLETKP